MRDPYLRWYQEGVPPLIPGTEERYHDICGMDDEDLQRVRDHVQNSGRHLYVLRHFDDKVLVEAYYGNEIRPAYFRDYLDYARRSDARMGRLVVINEWRRWRGQIPQSWILELRQNNRDARRDLMRAFYADEYRRQMRQREEEDRRNRDGNWDDAYSEAMVDTKKFAMNERVNVPAQIS